MFFLDGEDCSVEVGASSSTEPSNHDFPNYGCDTIELQGWAKFKRSLGERAVRFLHHPELQYIAVKNVSTSDIEYIDQLRSCGDLPQMRILYDEEKKLMIVKLMPGLPHEVAANLFSELFREMVPSSTGIVAVGSTKFGEVSRRHKEPDQSYVPRHTRFPNPDWPSVVLEVGVSESLHQLREDARYWLISSEGRVLVVILISIGLSSGDARWERWEHQPSAWPSTGPVTRRQTRIQPTLMQTVILPRGGPVSGAPFRIPSNKIWDVVPNNVGPKIVFSAQQLQYFSDTLTDCSQ
jgi:hypothetical protein